MRHIHQWDTWLAYDTYPVEMGLTDGFRYHRTCNVLNCNARQRAENLEPSGKVEETSGDEKAK